jgi:hypothetical protein
MYILITEHGKGSELHHFMSSITRDVYTVGECYPIRYMPRRLKKLFELLLEEDERLFKLH